MKRPSQISWRPAANHCAGLAGEVGFPRFSGELNHTTIMSAFMISATYMIGNEMLGMRT